tara:strand:- start:28 stop:480 length:453 start_codon:yes stop_codon:yes gene_type:complete
MNFIQEYFKGYFLNGRMHFPKTFNSNIAFANVISFGLTSLIMFFFYEPLAYLFFLILLTSTESDANISGNKLCNKILQKIDIFVIAITILVLFLKTGILYGLFLIPIILVHHWKRDSKNSEEYEIKMNIWHFVASIIAIFAITVYSILHT